MSHDKVESNGVSPPDGTDFHPKSKPEWAFADVCLAIATMVSWLFIFFAGMLFPAEKYKGLFFAETSGPWLTITSALGLFVSYGLTNMALLACLAALLGGILRGAEIDATMGNNEKRVKEGQRGLRLPPGWALYLMSVVKGFFCYLILMAGLLWFSTEALLYTNQPQYIRLAATISLLSFVSGYDAKAFEMILRRIVEFMQGQMAATERRQAKPKPKNSQVPFQAPAAIPPKG